MTDREAMIGVYVKKHEYKGRTYYETRYVGGCCMHHGRRRVFWNRDRFDSSQPYIITNVDDFLAWAVDAEFQGVAK